ncbi:MAG TPA: ADP-ribosylglycohydrolase family protein [Solirubrobacteraceae bacterium]|nr:ADP-ribosylglycohydrolase family protein [Solirubrobacteraceae bacterium]
MLAVALVGLIGVCSAILLPIIPGVLELGNLAATLMILRATDPLAPGRSHTSATQLALLLHAGYNLAATLASVPAGHAGDRRGVLKILAAGAGCFTLAYLGFATNGTSILLLAGYFILAGIGIGCAETAESAAVASSRRRQLGQPRGSGGALASDCDPYRVPVSPDIDRARGALLGTFVGDAVGMPFEGAAPAAIPERLTMLDARLGRGTYTDDTQMAIALAESLLERGLVDAEALGRAFVAAHDPRRGYGSGTTEVLRLVRSGVHPHDAAESLFGGEGSQGNGAAMRIAPVAVRYADDVAALTSAACASARVTHAHPLAVDAAVAQAVAIAAALMGDPPLDAALQTATTVELNQRLTEAARLLDSGPEPAELAAALGNRPTGHESVPVAIYSATAHESVEAAITFAVRCGGDTDTIGAMAGAIAAARTGASTIPCHWLDALEEAPKGRRYVESLADRLAAARAKR